MQMRPDGASLVADSFTHREKGAARRVNDQQNPSPGFFSLCTPQIRADTGVGGVGEGRQGSARTAIGRSPSTGVLWLCMSPGNFRTPWSFSIPQQLNGTEASPSGWLVGRINDQPNGEAPNLCAVVLTHGYGQGYATLRRGPADF